jgi:ankyrin repeat protein
VFRCCFCSFLFLCFHVVWFVYVNVVFLSRLVCVLFPSFASLGILFDSFLRYLFHPSPFDPMLAPTIHLLPLRFFFCPLISYSFLCVCVLVLFPCSALFLSYLVIVTFCLALIYFPHCISQAGHSPLGLAAAHGHGDSVAPLLERGADVTWRHPQVRATGLCGHCKCA